MDIDVHLQIDWNVPEVLNVQMNEMQKKKFFFNFGGAFDS